MSSVEFQPYFLKWLPFFFLFQHVIWCAFYILNYFIASCVLAAHSCQQGGYKAATVKITRSCDLEAQWAGARQNQQNDVRPAKTQISLGIDADWRLRSAWTSVQSDQNPWHLHEEALGPWISLERTLGAEIILLVLSCSGSNRIWYPSGYSIFSARLRSAEYTIGICFQTAKNTKTFECFFTGFQHSLWKFSTTGNPFGTPRPIPWIRPRMYVRCSIMCEIAAFCSPEVHA